MRGELKKSFITGLFVTIPLIVSIGLLVWFFKTVDRFFSPPIDGFVQVIVPGAAHIPGTGILAGLVIIFLVGLFARNVFGAKVIAFVEGLLDRIPGYRTVYSTVKHLANAFSPDNTRSFREVMLVQYPGAGSYAIGFRTGTVVRDGESLAVVFVPTNNLYLGEVLFIPERNASRLDLTVEQAITILVSGGIAAGNEFARLRQMPLDNRSARPVS